MTKLLYLVITGSIKVDGSPKRRKGSSSGWFGSSKKENKNSWSGSGRKSSKGKTLKKAAMIGAGAYVGYQLGQATHRFGGWHHGGGWDWNDYNRWRQEDGMLCRNNQDCTWMDRSMNCEDYEVIQLYPIVEKILENGHQVTSIFFSGINIKHETTQKLSF